MLFSSATFLFIFLPVTLLVYFACPKKLRNGILLLASLIFYAWGEPKYLIVMVITILVNYILARVCEKQKERGHGKRATAAFVASVVISLGLLGVFKYADFFSTNINFILDKAGAAYDIPMLKLVLPLGISFYTFQTMSYTIDVFRGEVKAQKSLWKLATYVCLFPQLIAGPIVRYQTVEQELTKRNENLTDVSDGILRFCIGLSKKILFANMAGEIFEQIRNTGDARMSVGLLWISSIAFSFQIYFDFSGYSDMAIGLGKIFGFHFLENFNYPYVSESITDFWRRWHMSLSTWFKDYLYIPLGGNRKGKMRTFFNLFVVWFLTGFWHGASWNFCLWGMYYFVILVAEKLFLGKLLEKLPKAFGHIYALVLINFGWVIFCYEDFGELLHVIAGLFGGRGLPLWNGTATFYVASYGIFFGLMALASTPFPKWLVSKLDGKIPQKQRYGVEVGCRAVFLILMLVLCTAGLASDSYNPFLYFRF